MLLAMKSFKSIFISSVVIQFLHSLEEYIFKLYEVFPPMVFFYRHNPDLAKPAFIAFNLLLISFGIFSYLHWVRHAVDGMRGGIRIWVGIQMATVGVHLVWALSTSGYHPGLATIPIMGVVSSYLAYELWRGKNK